MCPVLQTRNGRKPKAFSFEPAASQFSPKRSFARGSPTARSDVDVAALEAVARSLHRTERLGFTCDLAARLAVDVAAREQSLPALTDRRERRIFGEVTPLPAGAPQVFEGFQHGGAEDSCAHYNEVPYSPKCVEGKFSELRL